MISVIFELWPGEGQHSNYFDLAAQLRPQVDAIDGFICVERFESLALPGKYLSLSFWRDEAAVQTWRNQSQHRTAQAAGRGSPSGIGILVNYRLRVAHVLRDYGLNDREQAPQDSLAHHTSAETYQL